MTDLAAHGTHRRSSAARSARAQRALSLPHSFLYRLAYDHTRMVAVFGLFVQALLGQYARQAKARGLPDGETERSRSCNGLA